MTVLGECCGKEILGEKRRNRKGKGEGSGSLDPDQKGGSRTRFAEFSPFGIRKGSRAGGSISNIKKRDRLLKKGKRERQSRGCSGLHVREGKKVSNRRRGNPLRHH